MGSTICKIKGTIYKNEGSIYENEGTINNIGLAVMAPHIGNRSMQSHFTVFQYLECDFRES